MQWANVAQVLAANALWRATRLRSAGRALVRALGSPDETTKTLAGMFLARSGRAASPILREALNWRENLPLVLTIIGDIGDESFEPDLRRFAGDPEPAVATAARDALRLLERRRAPTA